jgi:hypothetical protein
MVRNFEGESSAMLNLECNKTKTDLPFFRLRNFSKHNKCGFVSMSVNRTVPSKLFVCRRESEKYSVYSHLGFKDKIFLSLAQFLKVKKSIEKRAGVMSRLTRQISEVLKIKKYRVTASESYAASNRRFLQV